MDFKDLIKSNIGIISYILIIFVSLNLFRLNRVHNWLINIFVFIFIYYGAIGRNYENTALELVFSLLFFTYIVIFSIKTVPKNLNAKTEVFPAITILILFLIAYLGGRTLVSITGSYIMAYISCTIPFFLGIIILIGAGCFARRVC
jgi:hypothetical protein